jgi:hypothetical protein
MMFLVWWVTEFKEVFLVNFSFNALFFVTVNLSAVCGIDLWSMYTVKAFIKCVSASLEKHKHFLSCWRQRNKRLLLQVDSCYDVPNELWDTWADGKYWSGRLFFLTETRNYYGSILRTFGYYVIHWSWEHKFFFAFCT